MDKKKIFKADVEIAIRRQIISSPDKVDMNKVINLQKGKGYFLFKTLFFITFSQNNET